jgi:outer membrane protein TolC
MRRAVTTIVGAALLSLLAPAAHGAPRTATALRLDEVTAAVTNRYPPLLAALIERDIADGRLTSASGVFDLNAFVKLFGTPAGYYQSGTVDIGVEQFTGIWGSTLFGGYRITRGEELPDYYSNRTQGAGEPRVGLRVPLLRDRAIDKQRAGLMKAALDRDLADPVIARQRLDFVRAATVAYFNWLASGQRLELAEALADIAQARDAALAKQVETGLVPRIVTTDNRRLVVSREIGIVQARRRFEGAGLALSLFYRSAEDEPIVAGRERLPADFPPTPPLRDPAQLERDIEEALRARPELRRLELALGKLEVDRRLAQNQMQPKLEAGVQLSQDFGEELYKDRDAFEVQAGVELALPLQRREAKGRVAEIEAQINQVLTEQRFARDRIRNEIRDAFSALVAAHEQIRQTRLNRELAAELQGAEEERFRRGATDLLALQLREQAAFDAQTLAVDAIADYFRAVADYRAAMAAPEPLTVAAH